MDRVRFTGVIQPGRRNPYVDVPAGVSAAFGPLARAARITVDGTLNGVSVPGTLVPMAAGGHRLYVNGGVAARGVSRRPWE